MAELHTPKPPVVFELELLSSDQRQTSNLVSAPGDLAESLQDRLNSLPKRIFDLLFGMCLLIILAPLMCLIALMVKLDSSGPILFRQPRIGFNGEQFTIFKFRTMRHDMADLLADRQTSRDDPRVTVFGQYLRRRSLDELPQLLNVIRGDMSLVGPRPHAPNTRVDGQFLWNVLDNYHKRHLARPGLTGWAQVNGARGEIRSLSELSRRVELDIEYTERWSLGLDFKILILTFSREIIRTSAY